MIRTLRKKKIKWNREGYEVLQGGDDFFVQRSEKASLGRCYMNRDLNEEKELAMWILEKEFQAQGAVCAKVLRPDCVWPVAGTPRKAEHQEHR